MDDSKVTGVVFVDLFVDRLTAYVEQVMSRRPCSKLFTLLLIFCTLKGVYNSLKDLNYRKIERAEDWDTKERVKSLFNLKQTKENVRHVGLVRLRAWQRLFCFKN